MNTKTNVDRYNHGIRISGVPDARTVIPGQAVRYHPVKRGRGIEPDGSSQLDAATVRRMVGAH